MAPSHCLIPTFDELLVQFRKLLDAHRAEVVATRAGEGNLRCEGCVDCNRCRFCVQCVRCSDCSNCELCHDCRACTRSRASRLCARSGHLEYCEGCEDSQYLILCVDCTNCTQCFACVGLKGEEFCVLNQRYQRKDYFPAVQALKKRLEEALVGGQLLPEIAASSHGLWPPVNLPPPPEKPSFAPPPAVEPEVEPWLDEVAPQVLRAESGPSALAVGPEVSWAPRPPRLGE